jgi:predicted transcriptional regulator YheO
MAESQVVPEESSGIVADGHALLFDLDPAVKQIVVEALGLVGRAVTETLGEWCEVVVHDLADLDHSIVSISGNVTGRKVGGNITDLGLARIRAQETAPLINYTSYTDDGKTLKCSTVFVCDETGKPYACVCLNVNITPVLLFDRFLQNIASTRQEPGIAEFFADDLTEMIESIIAEAAYEAGKPLSVMTKDDRLKMVAALEKRGLFQLRNSVPIVAKRLAVSRKTIYNYLSELGGGKQ